MRLIASMLALLVAWAMAVQVFAAIPLPKTAPASTPASDWRALYAEVQRQRLASNDEEDRLKACESLTNHPDIAKLLVPELAGRLKDENRQLRYIAASLLQRVGAGASAAVPQLMEMLRSDDSHDRVAAARALGAIGEPAKAAVPLLVRQMQSWNPAQRAAAARALGRTGIGMRAEVLPPLLNGLTDGSREVRLASAKAVETLGPEAEKSAITELRKHLNAKDPVLQMDCAIGLGRFTQDDEIALTAAAAVLRDPAHPVSVRVDAANALGQTGSPDAVAPLAKSLRYRDPQVIAAAQDALGRLGPVARLALPELERNLKHDDVHVRISANEAMERIRAAPVSGEDRQPK